jgi:hypothetical protein
MICQKTIKVLRLYILSFLMDWYNILKISALINFNILCLAGTLLTLYGFVVFYGISKSVKNTSNYLQNKLDNIESSVSNGFNDWGWLSVPVAGIIGSIGTGMISKKKNKDGLVTGILKKMLK